MDTIIYIYPLRERAKKENKKVKLSAEQKYLEKVSMEQGPWENGAAKVELVGEGEECRFLSEMYSMEEYDMLDYHLVRVGIGNKLAELCGGVKKKVSNMETMCTDAHKVCKKENFWRKRRRKKQMQAKQQREQELLGEFLHQIQRNEEQSYFVCEEHLPFFNCWEFNDYFEANWVKHMLGYGYGEKQMLICPHLLVLGQTHCLTEMVYILAEKLKSLKWILPARQYREEQQELTEDIYEEFGLAVDVHLLEDEDAYRKERICCPFPTLVLDFSEADRIPTGDIARESIWLDMAASEEKRRRIEERNTGIHYFSLKKEWKQPQKALFHLDTTNKNGYNT